MLIFRCDRCWREFNTIDLSKKDVFQVIINSAGDMLGYEAKAHICSECRKEFFKWLDTYQPPERIKNDP